jgi:hypothetical protein
MGRRNTIGESLSGVQVMSDEEKPDPERIRRVWRQFWLSIMLLTVGVSILVLLCFFALSGPAATPDSEAWSMYRSDPEDPTRRVHVATFDAGPPNCGDDIPCGLFNRSNCTGLADVIASNDPARKKWWCEPGRYRPGRLHVS